MLLEIQKKNGDEQSAIIIFELNDRIIVGNQVQINYFISDFQSGAASFHWENFSDRQTAQSVFDSIFIVGEQTNDEICAILKNSGLFLHRELIDNTQYVYQYSRPKFHPDSYLAKIGANMVPGVIWLLELRFIEDILVEYKIVETGFSDEYLLRKQLDEYWRVGLDK